MTKKTEPTEFTKRVVKVIRTIPRGKVATYGLVAKLAGKPHGSRGVGWILHSSTHKQRLPWHRVIKSTGRLSFPDSTTGFTRQKRFLEREGIEVVFGKVDLKKFLWGGKPTNSGGARRTIFSKGGVGTP